MIRFCIFDLRRSVSDDNRFISVIKALQETIILARTSPEIDWTHFGLIVIGNELNYQVLLPLQGLKSLSLTVFNKVFAQLRQMLSPKQMESDVDTKLKDDAIGTAMQNCIINNQLRDFKGRIPQVNVTVVTLRWKGVVEKELRDFTIRTAPNNPIKLIEVVELVESTGVKVTDVSDLIRIHSLPVNCLDIALEITFKVWLQSSRNLALFFPNNGGHLLAQTENITLNLPNQQNLPDKLSIVSFFPPSAIHLTMMTGQCVYLSNRGTNPTDQHRWNAFWSYAKDVEQAVRIQGNNDRPYALIPASENRFIMQPLIPSELQVPCRWMEDSPRDEGDRPVVFDTMNLPHQLNYGLGPKINLIHHLQAAWSKESQNPPPSIGQQPARPKPKAPRKPKTVDKEKTKKTTYAHPALGMY